MRVDSGGDCWRRSWRHCRRKFGTNKKNGGSENRPAAKYVSLANSDCIYSRTTAFLRKRVAPEYALVYPISRFLKPGKTDCASGESGGCWQTEGLRQVKQCWRVPEPGSTLCS